MSRVVCCAARTEGPMRLAVRVDVKLAKKQGKDLKRHVVFVFVFVFVLCSHLWHQQPHTGTQGCCGRRASRTSPRE